MLICIGGTSLDLHAQVEYPLVYGSSNPGRISMSPGGVARNIAENAARLGVPVALVTWAGSDPLSEWVLERTRESGVRVVARSGNRVEKMARYLSVLQAGQPLVAVSDFGAIEDLTGTEIRESLDEAIASTVRGSGHGAFSSPAPILVAADCNLPTAALTACVDWCHRHDATLLLEPVSVAKAARLRDLRGRVAYVTPNTDEARALGWIAAVGDRNRRGAAPNARGPDFDTWVVTRGARGAAVWRNEDDRAMLYGTTARRVVNANGAGDAFVAGFLAGLHEGLELEDAIGWALAAGAITVASTETVAPEMCREAIRREMERGR